jgi:hypothetical protein
VAKTGAFSQFLRAVDEEVERRDVIEAPERADDDDESATVDLVRALEDSLAKARRVSRDATRRDTA